MPRVAHGRGATRDAAPGMSYAVVIGTGFLVTLAVTPFFRRLSVRIGAVVAPDERRVHEHPLPILGGAAMLLGLLAAVLVAWQLDDFAPVFEASTAVQGVVLGAVVMWGVGQIDDLREVSPPAKLAGTVLAGSVLSLAGVSILFFRIPFAGLLSLSPDLSALITVVWVIGMSTAINYIDGLDGLAAGIVAIAAGTFVLYGERLNDVGVIRSDNAGPLIAACVLGVCLGFLPHNFHPARIIMGDAGALMLGLLMAAATIAVGGNSDQPFSGQTFFFFAPLFIPLVILGVPIFDTAFSIVRRASRGVGVAVADKDHLHHRLMRLGHGHRRSVLILWTWTALLSGLVLYPTYRPVEGAAIVPAGIVVLGLVLYTLFAPGLRRTNGNGSAEPAVPPHEEVGEATH
jgi:UDP-GlcNAc:undecaprenyl-phosphate/decaprenyl-phosphate GlcNAc-1-phosphate transferase